MSVKEFERTSLAVGIGLTNVETTITFGCGVEEESEMTKVVLSVIRSNGNGCVGKRVGNLQVTARQLVAKTNKTRFISRLDCPQSRTITCVGIAATSLYLILRESDAIDKTIGRSGTTNAIEIATSVG